MFRTKGADLTAANHAYLSFRKTDAWLRTGDAGELVYNLILMGDEDVGPAILLTSTSPGIELERAVAHAHASDNWRISLLGAFHMGPDTYGPGDFRLQEGWKTYPDDDNSYGPDGGWEFLIFGDRRGVRRRLAVEPVGFEYPEEEGLRELARIFRFSGDILSDDPTHGAGPSAIATTLAAPNYTELCLGKMNGSVMNSAKWIEVDPETRIAVTLLGDREAGPVLIFTDTRTGAIGTPPCRFGTEVYRLVVDGQCSIGDQTYRKGDMGVVAPGTWCDRVEAGPHGLREVIVLGDRRFLEPDSQEEGWPSALPRIVKDLSGALEIREQQRANRPAAGS